MEEKPLILFDRSRITTDWKCPRSRCWQYEYLGLGIVPHTVDLPLFLGICHHDALAVLAEEHRKGGDATLIAKDLATKVYQQVFDGLYSDEYPADAHTFAQEQATLMQGMIYAFAKWRWPQLLKVYPKVIFTEAEMHYDIFAPNGAKMRFMAKPDLVMATEDESEVIYFEAKTTSSKKDAWINSWQTAVQLHSTVAAIEETHGITCDAVVVQGFYKGYECLSPETPILTADLRWLPVGELKVGDTVAGFDEQPTKHWSGRSKKRQWRTATVTHAGRKVLPSYKLVLEDGTDFVCSENHLWLTTRDGDGSGSATWIKTKDLKKGTKLIKVCDTWEEDKSYEAGYLAAALDGEGNLSQHQTKNGHWLTHIGFTQKENEMLAAVKTGLAEANIKFGFNDKRGSEKIGGIYIHNQARIMKTLGTLRPKRLLPKFSFDKLGGVTTMGKALSVKSLTFLGDCEVVTIGTTTETLVAKGIATHNSYGKQSSPFCYSYRKQGQPPLTTDQFSYEYKSGWYKYPTWQMKGGVFDWIDGMSDEMLAEQFPCTAPIYIDRSMVERFFAQVGIREADIRAGRDVANKFEIQRLEGSLSDKDAKELTWYLDAFFPQRFDQCQPSFGSPCAYRRLCHGGTVNPLENGFTFREPHHEDELVQQRTEALGEE